MQKPPGNKQKPSDRRLEDFLGKSSKLRANAIIAVSVFDSSMEKALLRKGSFFCAKGRVAKLDCGVACAKALGPVIASYAKYVWGEKGLCAKRLLRALWGKRGVLGLSLYGQACFAPMLGCFFPGISLLLIFCQGDVSESLLWGVIAICAGVASQGPVSQKCAHACSPATVQYMVLRRKSTEKIVVRGMCSLIDLVFSVSGIFIEEFQHPQLRRQRSFSA